MSLRTDTPIARTRKNYNCEWCHYRMPKGSHCVYVRGLDPGEGFWSGRFHPECWRAEIDFWRAEKWADSWPEDTMMRGANAEPVTWFDYEWKSTLWLPNDSDHKPVPLRAAIHRRMPVTQAEINHKTKVEPYAIT